MSGKHVAPKSPNAIDAALEHDDGQRSDRGYCYGVEDGLDGYAVHVAECRSVGRGWSGPNSDCYLLVGNRWDSWIRCPDGTTRKVPHG